MALYPLMLQILPQLQVFSVWYSVKSGLQLPWFFSVRWFVIPASIWEFIILGMYWAGSPGELVPAGSATRHGNTWDGRGRQYVVCCTLYVVKLYVVKLYVVKLFFWQINESTNKWINESTNQQISPWACRRATDQRINFSIPFGQMIPWLAFLSAKMW